MRHNRLRMLSMILAGVLFVGSAYWLAGTTYGATRFYFPAMSYSTYTITPAIVTTFFGTWNAVTTAATIRVRLGRSFNKLNFSTGGTQTRVRVTCTAVANTYIIMRQFISDPICNQIISGVVSGEVLCGATTALNNTLAVFICLINSNGTARATLLGMSAYEGAAGSCTIPTATTRARRFMNAASTTYLPLTTQEAQNGDRIVVEVGYRQTTATGGRSITMYFGDSGVSDITGNDTTLSTTTLYCPWIEFSQNITFPILTPLLNSD